MQDTTQKHEEVEGDEDEFASDFSDEEKRHKEMKSKFRITKTILPAEIQSLIGEANLAYLLNDFEKAEVLCKEIISKYPSYPDPYNVLAQMFEEKNQIKEAADYYFLAAYTSRTDSQTWEKIACLYKKENFYELSGYCFGRALKSDTMNQNLWKQRAACYEQTGELRKAIKCLERITKMDDSDDKIIKHIAKLYWRNGNNDTSIKLLKDLLKKYENDNYDIINMICEIYYRQQLYDKLQLFLEEIFEIKNYDDEQFLENLFDDIPLILLKVFLLVYSNLKIIKIQNICFKILLNKPNEDIEEYEIQIFEEIGDQLEKLQEFQLAVQIYNKILEFQNLEDIINQEINEKIALLYPKLYPENPQKSIDFMKNILEQQDYNQQFQGGGNKIRLELSKLYQRTGQGQKALEILDDINLEMNDQDLNIECDQITKLNSDLLTNQPSIKQESINFQQNKDQNINEFEYEDDEIDLANINLNNYDITNNLSNKFSQKEEFKQKQEYDDEAFQFDFGNETLLQKKQSTQVKKEYQDIENSEDNIDNMDNDEALFYSDGEENIKNINKQRIQRQQIKLEEEQLKKKVKRKDSDSDYDINEDLKQQRNYKKSSDDIDQNLQNQGIQEENPLYFDRKAQEKKEMKKKYNFNKIQLAYQKGQVLFKNPQFINRNNLENLFVQAKQSLLLEKEVNDLKTSINNKFMYETKRKTFKKVIKAPNSLQQFDKPIQHLMIKNKQNEIESEMLMKRKKKVALKLTDNYIQEMEYLSKNVGKEEYLIFITELLKLLNQKNLNNKLLKITTLVTKLKFLREVKYQKYKDIIYNYGLSAAVLIGNYEKAFIYLRYIITQNSGSLYLCVLMNLVFSKIKNGNIYRTFMHSLSQKTKKNQQENFIQIIANGHIETGNFDLAIKDLTNIQKTNQSNTLINLTLTACYLQQVSTRVTKNKEELARIANFYMELYIKTRGSEFKMECDYNLGRYFSHLKLYERAIFYYNQVLQLYITKQNKNIQLSNNDRSIFLKAIHNLIIIHKQLGNMSLAQQYIENYMDIDQF